MRRRTSCYKWVVLDINTEVDVIIEKKRNHHRFSVFYHKGKTCVKCGITGNRIVTWIDNGDGIHKDLYYIDRSTKSKSWVLMTVDHIIPRSKGGKNHIDNMQPMCERCNSKKSNKLEEVTV